MPLRRTLTALVLALTLTTGCSMTHGDPKNPKKNPHPVKRYEVIATADAPGPWDSVKGYIGYDVINKDCVPRGSFTGGQNVPNISVDMEMTRVNDKTWRGYFYRDALANEDYFELGVCHWDVTSVSVITVAQGINFGWGGLFEKLLHHSPEMRYFKKSDYGDQHFVRYGAPDLSPTDPKVLKHLDAYFRVTIAVKEVTP